MQRREKSGSTSFNRHLVTNWLACRKMTNASSKWWRWELKNQQGNREMSIPFCLSTTLIPNKWPSSVNPLNGLICTLNRKSKMKEDYFQFMGKVCKCGHAVPAPEDELLPPYIPKGKNHWNAPNWTGSREQAAGDGNKGRVWYLSHFGVYHPRKPDQILTVFNSSEEFQGVLLNKELLPGPDLMNSLVGVLIHFPQDNIAMMCDIDQMFNSF